MNPLILILCALSLAMTSPSYAVETATKAPLCGGWSSAALTNANVIAAADFAVKAHEKALKEKSGAEAITLELVSIQDAAQQVVAGLNYRLKLKVRHDGKEKTAFAIVWWQAWRKQAPYQLTSWTWE